MERRSLESSVSFHLSAYVPPPPPLHRGTPGTRIYSAEHASLFLFSSPSHVLPVPPLQACFGKREAFSSVSAGITRQLHINGSCPSRGAQLQISSSGTSVALFSVQESQCPPLVAAEASYVQTAAASGWKRWHLLTAFLSLPSLSLSSLPYQETRRNPAGRGLQG